MLTIAAEAALFFLWENYPSLVLDCKMSASCGDIRKHLTTEQVVFSVSSIHSFSIVLCIIIGLAIDLVVGSILNVSLVKGNLERLREYWRVNA